MAAIEQANARIEHLRGPGARWSVLVNDRISDLTHERHPRLRSGMREISREMDERIEVLKKGDEWDEVTRHLQTRVADEVTRAFVAVEQGDRSIRAEAVELLAEEQLDLGTSRATAGRRIDVALDVARQVARRRRARAARRISRPASPGPAARRAA